MVKLTAELIEQAAQYTNAVRDRELDLRGARARPGSDGGPGGVVEAMRPVPGRGLREGRGMKPVVGLQREEGRRQDGGSRGGGC